MNMSCPCPVLLTLEGADEVAPELGLLREGRVVGVQVEVHLAHAAVVRHLGGSCSEWVRGENRSECSEKE